jgi:hypothetical protein
MKRMFLDLDGEQFFDIRGENYEVIKSFINSNFIGQGKHYGSLPEIIDNKSKPLILINYTDGDDDIEEINHNSIEETIKTYEEQEDVDSVQYLGFPTVLNV